MKFLSLLLALLFLSIRGFAADTLIAKHSFWKYRADSTSLGTDWKTMTYSDSTWKIGQAILGYGIGNAATTLDFGPNPNQKYITTYFRKSIVIDSTKTYNSYTFNIRRDDGFVLYINGNEAFRNNIGTGTISYSTLAQNANDEGLIDIKFTLPNTIFQKGENLIALELHQVSAYTNDALFDLELIANTQAVLTHSPYLQKVSNHSSTIRWQTSTAIPTSLHYGFSPDSLPFVYIDTIFLLNHELTLSNLQAQTAYFYSIDDVENNDVPNQYFRTFPSNSKNGKTRIWATGDCGNASINQIGNMQQQQQYLNQDAADVWLLLGDNAYESGYYEEYQHNFFDIFAPILPHTPLYPAPGNHEYANNSDRQNDHAIAYYDVFSLPTQGEAGGIASGTESYYSFNHGDIHFLSLDSYGKEDSSYRLYDTLSAQVQWIKQDLAASTQKWKIAYWHHPPYTKGSHNSDWEYELVAIRQNLLRILERYGVDLVLCGHSHAYERSVLLSGYYSDAASFDAHTHSLNTSSAHYDGSQNSCPYLKKDKGTVYVVSGSAGKVGGVQSDFPHPAMAYSNATNGGSLMVEIENNRLDVKWLCVDGQIRDYFTMMKNVQKNDTIVVGFGQNIDLHASWQGQYLWQNGSTSPFVSLSTFSDTIVTVSDNWACLEDTFLLQLPITHPIDIVDFRANAVAQHKVELAWTAHNPSNFDHFVVERSLDKLRYSVIGQVPFHVSGSYTFADNNAPNGLVYYRVRALDKQHLGFTSQPVPVYLYNQSTLFSFYPNPLSVADALTINILTSNSETAFFVEIMNNLGQIVYPSTYLAKGSGNYSLYLDNCTAGFYFVKIYGENRIWTEKIFVRN